MARIALVFYIKMDWYLEDKSRLEGQPKRTISDYVSRNGILVPRRFDNITDARNSGLPVICRSEHKQEYDGVSGLLTSPDLSSIMEREERDEEALIKKVLSEPEVGTSLFRQYCRFTGTNEEEFKQGVSFSFWQRIFGLNRTVIADSAIPSRFHVMTNYTPTKEEDDEKNWLINYCIFENGKIAQEWVKPLTPELKVDLPNLVGIYENVRQLSHFDSNHCPVMEFQTAFEGNQIKNYFLQYHRTRNFEPATFVLKREPKKREFVADFVRGATASEGMKCKVVVYYAGEENWDFKPDGEDGAYDLYWNHVFPELQLRKRKVQMHHMRDNSHLSHELMKLAYGHDQRSKYFKSQVLIVHDLEKMIGKKGIEKKFREAYNGKNGVIFLDIISDGRKAYLKRVD